MTGFNFAKKHPGLTTLLVLELLLLLIVSYQYQVNRHVDVLEESTLMILGPVQELNDTIVEGVTKVFQDQQTRSELVEENQRFREALAGYNQLRIDLEEARLQNERLQELLDMPREQTWRYLPARVIGSAHRRNDYMITINRGSRSGVRNDLGVYSPEGIVGVIWETSGGYAKVMTINNPSAAVAALVQNSRYNESYVTGFDLLEGRLKNFPNFEFLQQGNSILTSGMDGIFPRGLHIGHVASARQSSYLFQDVSLTFAADFSRLEEVVVLIPVCEDELEAAVVSE